MKKCPLTLVGALLLLVAAFVVVVNNKKPETTKQPQSQSSSMNHFKPRLKVQKKETEIKQEEGFIIETRVSMHEDPYSKG